MQAFELPWETWRAIIAVLREKALPYMLDHADALEQQLQQHPADPATVILHLTDDRFLPSSTWARWPLGIPLPLEGRSSPRAPGGVSS